MKFLDLNGLKHLLKFMDRTVIVPASKFETNSRYVRDIPFVRNHQIIKMDVSGNINVFNWFNGASDGDIVEIVFAGAQGGYTYAIDDMNTSILYKMGIGKKGPALIKLDYLATEYNTYARLIKLNERVIVEEFVQNN